MAIGALILGIVAILYAFIPLAGLYVGMGISAVAVVLGVLGRKGETGKGMATGGLVLGIIALVLNVTFLLVCNAAKSKIESELGSVEEWEQFGEQMQQELEKMENTAE